MMDIQLPKYTAEPVALEDGQVVDWGHSYLQAQKFYSRTRGFGAIVFVLDTAGEFTHPDLVDNALPEYDRNVTNSPKADAHGHGTHCAGIIGASDNTVGVIGVAPEVGLVACKCLNDSGSGSFEWVADQIRYVADLQLKDEHKGRAKIISLSLGGSPGVPSPKVLSDAIEYAVSKGVYIVAAAGNWGAGSGDRSTVGAPGNHPLVLTVASSQRPGDQRSSFSSVGSEVDLMAPGSSIYSTHKDGGYARLSGTSMACPQVSGLVALIVSAGEFNGQQELVRFITAYATDVLAKGKDDESGWGSPVVVPYLDKLPKDDRPIPDPNPDPVPDPGPGPEPDPDILPGRRAVASIPYAFPGETFSIMYRVGSEPMRAAIIGDVVVESTNKVDAVVMGGIVRGYLRDFFEGRVLVLPANYDFYDVAVYTAVFLQLIAQQTWVIKKYKTKLLLTVASMRVSGSSVHIEIDAEDVKNRVAEMSVAQPYGVYMA